MNKSVISKAIESGNIVWRKHALERMLERDIARDEVIETILNGIDIENYPNDKPYASALYFKIVNGRPLHTVISLDEINEVCYIVTAYIPSEDVFEKDFTTRKKL